jgi:hypothetical protein
MRMMLRGREFEFAVVLAQMGHRSTQGQSLAIKQQGQAVQVVALARDGHTQAQGLHLFLGQSLGHGVHR